MKIRNDRLITFHKEIDGKIKTFTAIDKNEVDQNDITLAQNEYLSEELRLMYVALTRAVYRCYILWGKINCMETSSQNVRSIARERIPCSAAENVSPFWEIPR